VKRARIFSPFGKGGRGIFLQVAHRENPPAPFSKGGICFPFGGLVVLILALLSASPLLAVTGSSDVETVYIVQPKTINLRNRFELGARFLKNLNNLTINEMGGNLSLTFHVLECLALELTGGYFFLRNNSVASEQLATPANGGLKWNLVDYYRLSWLAMLGIQWSPLDGKLVFHDVFLGRAQFYLRLGAGMAGLEIADPSFKGDARLSLDQPYGFVASVGGGARWYVANHLSLTFEVSDLIQMLAVKKSETPGGLGPASSGIVQTVIAQLGVGVLF